MNEVETDQKSMMETKLLFLDKELIELDEVVENLKRKLVEIRSLLNQIMEG